MKWQIQRKERSKSRQSIMKWQIQRKERSESRQSVMKWQIQREERSKSRQSVMKWQIQREERSKSRQSIMKWQIQREERSKRFILGGDDGQQIVLFLLCAFLLERRPRFMWENPQMGQPSIKLQTQKKKSIQITDVGNDKNSSFFSFTLSPKLFAVVVVF